MMILFYYLLYTKKKYLMPWRSNELQMDVTSEIAHNTTVMVVTTTGLSCRLLSNSYMKNPIVDARPLLTMTLANAAIASLGKKSKITALFVLSHTPRPTPCTTYNATRGFTSHSFSPLTKSSFLRLYVMYTAISQRKATIPRIMTYCFLPPRNLPT